MQIFGPWESEFLYIIFYSYLEHFHGMCFMGYYWERLVVSLIVPQCCNNSSIISVNMDSGNGLLSDGTKPSPEPMLTDIINTLFHLWETMSQNPCELISSYFCEGITGEHDDVIKWKHFRRYWPFVWGIQWSLVNSPHKGQWHGDLMFSLICAWINGWVNNGEAGDLRHHLVMSL